MDDLEALVAKQQCLDFLQEVRRAADNGDVATFAGSFLPDGAWRRPGVDPVVGPEAVEAFMSNRPVARTTRHVTGGAIVELDGPDRAVVHSQVVLYAGPASDQLPITVSGPEKVFEYADTLRRTADGWRIAERVTTVVFSAT